MFERFTEEARRAIFFASFEGSACASPIIERRHLLIGILRADPAVGAFFPEDHDPLEALREEFRNLDAPRRPIVTNQSLPLAHDSKRALAYAAEEAERLSSRSITTKHLFLGLLHEEEGPAWEALSRRGLSLEACQRRVAQQLALKPGKTDAATRNALWNALNGYPAHAPAARVFKGLDFALAGRRAGATHTIFEILSHLLYWQELCLAYVRGERPLWPASDADSWPGPPAPATEDQWRSAVERFQSSLAELDHCVEGCDLLASPGGRTNLEAIQAAAQHNSYHLGQVVILRQLLGAWPPPAD